MKNFTLLILLSVFSFSSYSQVFVDGVNINELDIEYCELTWNNGNMFASISYGQEKYWKKKEISDNNGKIYPFNSIVEALNFMVSNGWEFVSSDKVTILNTIKETYLLKKKEK